MQQKKHIRNAAAIILGLALIIAAGIAPGTLYAAEGAGVSAPAEEDVHVYEVYEPTIYGWANVAVHNLEFVSLHNLRLVSVYDGIALGVISATPEDMPGGDYFVTSHNKIDWEIQSPAAGWYVYHDGNYYWYAGGLFRTSDWRNDWQFHPTPTGEYELDDWESIMSYIYDNFEYVNEITFMALWEAGISRIERLPYLMDENIMWVGFVVTEDARRNQIRIFLGNQWLNPLGEDAQPALAGIEGFGWAREAILFSFSRDLMDMYACPYSGEYIEFNPMGSASRGDVLAAAVKALGLTAPDSPYLEHTPFDDVPLYGRGVYIDIAKQLGLVAGIGNNQFAPDRTISRQDMMTMLYNILLALGQIQPDYDLTALGRFRDIGEIASYARLPIASLARAGIIAGSGVNINPRGYMTRVEAAMFVWNLYRVENG
ncbi:MAG: S-layer homology domain-containing protein [Defluviitaleaceae bacterium]|nr:S-layer homology domain-containing protein [Defluviitaleaceae bacterium]